MEIRSLALQPISGENYPIQDFGCQIIQQKNPNELLKEINGRFQGPFHAIGDHFHKEFPPSDDPKSGESHLDQIPHSLEQKCIIIL